jgi:glutamate/tyrosine decarboxylase-like PLP-dependent enzyme
LEATGDRPIGAAIDLAQLRARFDHPLPQAGTDPVQVIDQLVRDVDGAIIGSASGRFFAWVIGGSLPAALAADWLTSVWDQDAAIYACGPTEAVIEEVAGKWLKDLFGVPQTASFAFVTRTQMAHVTCLAAARHRLLKRTFSHRTSYRVQVGDARDQIDWNPEWSRRGRGVATYAALRQLGRAGIERTCTHAHALVTRIGGPCGAEVVWVPTINQGLVRFIDTKPGATDHDHDRRTDAIISRICCDWGSVLWGHHMAR